MARTSSYRLFGVRMALAAAVCAAAALAGCGISDSSGGTTLGGISIAGHVRSGRQLVGGARVQLFVAGTAGAGAGAIDLTAAHVIISDGNGLFKITGDDYVCPNAGAQIYLVARGGSPGLPAGQTNPALALMAALGSCGALTNSSAIVINEVTTAAAAWALAQFMGAGAEVGADLTNATGLANAFTVAENLADVDTGTAPGAALPATATAETAKLNTLANVLAACAGSDGATGCASLFSAATTAAGAPTTTLDAAMNIVRNPGTNIAAVYNSVANSVAANGAQAGPFQPSLGAASHDWSMSITYSGGGLDLPGGVAIDSGGNVAVANYFGGVVSKFSPGGIPVAAGGIAGTGLSQSYGVAVDAGDNIWVTNYQSTTGANNHHHGSVSKFSSNGAELSGYGYTSGGVYYPIALAADSMGSIWVGNYGASSATLLNDDGTAVSGSGGYAAGALPFVSAVALDAGHNAWFGVQGGVARVTPAGAAANYSCCAGPAGIAVDQSGNVWVADYAASAVVKLTSAGVIAQMTVIAGGNGGPQAIALDGADDVWVGNYYGNSLLELSGSTAAVASPTAGFGLDAPLREPYGLAIDASGDVWLSNSGANTLTEFVGLAGPVKTPLLGPPVQP